MIRIQREDFSIQEEMTRLTRGLHRVGGVVAFVGTVRDLAQDQTQDESVVAMSLEHYPGMTEGQLEKIEVQARQRFDLEALLVVHRVGRLNLEENIVLVIAAAAHRATAFDACRHVIDHLKIFATFWKKEILASGTQRWVHSCPGCIAAATHWQDFASVPHRTDDHCHKEKHSPQHEHGHQPDRSPEEQPTQRADWTGLSVGILTLSDTRNLATDKSGDGLEKTIRGYGVKRVVRWVIRDEREEIERLLVSWSDAEKIDVILTTGGTGPGPRDVTPEATRTVTQREMPGFAETIRREGLRQVRSALLTRGIAAFRGETLIINLPGSTRGA
ncbi:MAG TPA: hypothetical protein HPQ00_15110, partial [Magnetococcales bacterium]|nr:hypothetical protein [Magnetococcales bacterium]